MTLQNSPTLPLHSHTTPSSLPITPETGAGPRDSSGLRVTVGIATRSRPLALIDTLTRLAAQSTQPTQVFISYVDPGDIGNAPELFPAVTFLQSAAGLTRQRNRILVAAQQTDILLFIDDDFTLHPGYIAATQRVFTSLPGVVGTTGTVLADGINSRGLTALQADALLAAWAPPAPDAARSPVFNSYGCNMAVRMSAVRAGDLQFDEALPLYGWYEDVAFSRELSRFGDLLRIPDACGVHLGVKSGRQSGVRLGYSQVANPFYLANRGLVSWLYAASSMCSRTLKNSVRSVRPEPWIDRAGRLRGNALGWLDLLRGRLHPTRILSL